MSSIVCVGNVLVTNLVAQDEQSVGGALFQTSYTVGFALGNNLSSLLIQRLGNDSGDLLHGLRAASGLNTACAWISEFPFDEKGVADASPHHCVDWASRPGSC